MGFSQDRYYSTTIEIIATSRAKELAAKKCNIPFEYGNEIETYGVQFKNTPKHVHVDTKNISNTKRMEYFSLLKKYTKKEFNKLANPIHTNILMATPVFILATLCVFGLVKCHHKSKPTPKPQTVQKANLTSFQQVQNTR